MFLTRRRQQQLKAVQDPVPVITSVSRGLLTVCGTGFGQKTGPAKLEVNESGSWTERSTAQWLDTAIQHAPPLLFPGTKVRVTNSFGNVSNEFIAM